MPNELQPVDKFNQMNDVVTAHLKGDNPTQIAKSLGLTRKQVLQDLDDWRMVARNSKTIQARASEALVGMDEHFNMIIRELWEATEQADLADDYRAKADILKKISDAERNRVDALQKAGVLDTQSIGNEIIENEKKQEKLIAILREVTADCSHCKYEVSRRLTEITGQVEKIVT